MPRSPAKLCLATLFSRRLKALGGIYAKLTPFWGLCRNCHMGCVDSEVGGRWTDFFRFSEHSDGDHRYYHHSRINQSLHLFSAISFVCAYIMVFTNPVAAALSGWLAAMTTRQIGHFFFEPKGYDEVNHATHEYKEEIKVGYNLQRKVVLMSIWAFSPLVLYFDPTLFGIFSSPANDASFTQKVALIWLFIAAAGVIYRTVQLFFIKDVQTGLAWMTKF